MAAEVKHATKKGAERKVRLAQIRADRMVRFTEKAVAYLKEHPNTRLSPYQLKIRAKASLVSTDRIRKELAHPLIERSEKTATNGKVYRWFKYRK